MTQTPTSTNPGVSGSGERKFAPNGTRDYTRLTDAERALLSLHHLTVVIAEGEAASRFHALTRHGLASRQAMAGRFYAFRLTYPGRRTLARAGAL